MQPSVTIAVRAMRQAREHMLLTLNQYEILTPDTPKYEEALNYLNKDAYKILFDAIKRAYPTHFVTDSAQAPEDKEDSWHFKGIHAPHNLLRKDAASAFSLVHRHKGKTQDALVINILSGDEYTASRGKGAALNDRRARCTALPKLEHALCAVQLGEAGQDRIRSLELFNKLSSMTRDLRIGDCEVLDMVMVASGQRDLMAILNPDYQSCEAAALIAHEAGVLTAQFDGAPFGQNSRSVIAANPKLLKAAVQLLHGF